MALQNGKKNPLGKSQRLKDSEILVPDPKLHQTKHLPNLLKILNSCYDNKEPDWKLDKDKLFLKQNNLPFKSLEKDLIENINNNEELRAALVIYIDKEKVEQENLRDKIKRMQQQQNIEDEIRMVTVDSKSHMKSPHRAGSAKSASLRSLNGNNNAHSSRRHREQLKEIESRVQEVASEYKLDGDEDAEPDEKLVSLKEIYVDMKKNSELDYENFLRPEIIQQCLEDKHDCAWYVQSQCNAGRRKPEELKHVMPSLRGLKKKPKV